MNTPIHLPAQGARILVRGVNWLGDAVMTTPALLRLREYFPTAHITLFCPDKAGDLWLHHPAINEVMTFESGEAVFSIGRKLRAGKFDLALVLPNSPRSAMEVFFASIPQRVGYARPWRNFFLTRAVAPRAGAVKMRKRTVSEIQALVKPGGTEVEPSAFNLQPSTCHQVHEYLHLAAALGANPGLLAPRLAVTPEEVESAKAKFGLGKISQPIFGLNPGAEYGPAKRWPAERFIAAANEIQKQTNCRWLIFGGKGDAELVSHIETGITHHELVAPKSGAGGSLVTPLNLAGKTSLRELMALLKLCRVLLTNDTGPMHVAAALGTPVVVPFGSTSPELTRPVSAGGLNHQIIKSDAPCSPCFLRECPIDFRCMNGIGTGQVVSAILQVVR